MHLLVLSQRPLLIIIIIIIIIQMNPVIWTNFGSKEHVLHIGAAIQQIWSLLEVKGIGSGISQECKKSLSK